MREAEIPTVLHGELAPGMEDVPREWCTMCGLPDAPTGSGPPDYKPTPPCPRCGSTWRWYGRIADRDGTATGPPDDGECRCCDEWRRYPGRQAHFGWGWWRVSTCDHEHHKKEVWYA